MRKKVLYVISCNGAGQGGHNHSLDHISRAMASEADIKIVSIGLTESPVLKSNPHYHAAFKFRWWSFLGLQRDFKKLFKQFNPDVIHCFDGGAALMLMTLPIVWGKAMVHTKCGGPNERNMIAQFLNDVILFSPENYLSYQANPRFEKADLHLIPNRIFKVDVFEGNQQEIPKDKDRFTFARISRIGKTYQSSLMEAIELIRKLHRQHDVKLIIIGNVEDSKILENLQDLATEAEPLPVTFLTDKKYTEKASRMLYLADAVIGTGRGVMEAMTLGIPTLVPVQGSRLPCLLFDKSFEGLLRTNFSQRGKMEGATIDRSLELVEKLISHKEVYQQMSEWSKNMAEEFFLVNPKVRAQYLSIYENAITKPRRNLLFKNILPIVYYINAYRRVQNRIGK